MMPRAGLLALLGASVLLSAPALAQNLSFEQVSRGRELVTAGDCVACHTPEGAKPFSGGRAVETPFGNILTPNITPDRATGIGAWSDDEFVRAMQQGIGRNGEHLYPAFPYTAYTKIKRNDLIAMRAYLNTLEPVSNAVDVNQLPFPFNMRFVMTFWNALFFTPGEFKDNPQKSAEWNRGAYLVEGLGHCASCHTAKNALGGDETAMEGGNLQNWFAPNLTGDKRVGLGGWSADDLVDYLKTGHTAHTAASGPMAEVIEFQTSKMPDADLKAMAAYLKDIPPSPDKKPTPLAADDAAMKAGAAIYADNCSACHVGSGEGLPKLFPALKGSAIVQSDDPTTLLRVILEGGRSVATDGAPTAPAMPAFDWKLSDAQTAAVATYVRNAWGNAAGAVDARSAASMRGALRQE
ncbi:MAG TPA: c-type cytochrome [Alphaproteobacteria bacterium]|jgi:mono/diheme cytochrome c family protein